MTEESVDARLARIETKIDQFLSQSSDHETRIRVLEGARFVTVPQMWAFMTGLLSIITVAIYILDLAVK